MASWMPPPSSVLSALLVSVPGSWYMDIDVFSEACGGEMWRFHLVPQIVVTLQFLKKARAG